MVCHNPIQILILVLNHFGTSKKPHYLSVPQFSDIRDRDNTS